MTGLGRYLAALEDVATAADEPRLARLVQHLRRPLCVGVRGRTGAGCATVSRALRRRGATVLAGADAVDAAAGPMSGGTSQPSAGGGPPDGPPSRGRVRSFRDWPSFGTNASR